MTGLHGRRVYLDWNATAPLRPEAREAMLVAMDAVGNPASVHSEGRATRAIVERARGDVAALVGVEPSELVFTASATESAALLLSGRAPVHALATEHDAVAAWADHTVAVDRAGRADADAVRRLSGLEITLAVQAANSETGVLNAAAPRGEGAFTLRDVTQVAGKSALRQEADATVLSAHKLGGPKGCGALTLTGGVELAPLIRGGGQEMGRRSGTENVIGIAGFGAAAKAAQRDLEAGVWERVVALRNILEDGLEAAAPELIFFGREAERLPNTSCFAVPGWRGETQVMQLDLAGFAVSAGSACSSGKLRESRVLRAMGYDETTAASAIRVSLGPTTTEAEIRAFVDCWTALYRRRAARAA